MFFLLFAMNDLIWNAPTVEVQKFATIQKWGYESFQASIGCKVRLKKFNILVNVIMEK
jgi:hypothetical protein